MDSNTTLKPSADISSTECRIKVISTCKVQGKINVTVRLVKTPPVSPNGKSVEQNPKGTWTSSSLPNSPVHKSAKERKMTQHPADFIEPVPSTKEFMQTEESEDNELCDTLPILPRAYSIRPSVALRNSIKRKSQKCKFSPSPRFTKKTFVNFHRS